MLVQAKAKGHYKGLLRQEGDRFELDSKDDFGSWMTPLDDAGKKVQKAFLAKRDAQARQALDRTKLAKVPVDFEERLAAVEAVNIDLQEKLELVLLELAQLKPDTDPAPADA